MTWQMDQEHRVAKALFEYVEAKSGSFTFISVCLYGRLPSNGLCISTRVLTKSTAKKSVFTTSYPFFNNYKHFINFSNRFLLCRTKWKPLDFGESG